MAIGPILSFISAVEGVVSTVQGFISAVKASPLYQLYEYVQAEQDAQRAIEASKTYNGDCSVTQCNPQAPVPVIYGEHKMAGNIIYQRFSTDKKKQYLLVALCRGPVEAINDIRLNDYTLSELECSCIPYYGTAGQRVSYNYLTDEQYGVKDLNGFQNLGATTFVRDTSTHYESAVSPASIKTTAEGGSGFQTALRPCTPGVKNTASVYMKLGSSSWGYNYGYDKVSLSILEYDQFGNPVGTPTVPKICQFSYGWAQYTVSKDFSSSGVQMRIKVLWAGEGPALTGTWYTDELTAYEDTNGLPVLHGAADVGGLKNLAYLALTMVKSDKLGDGVPNVTCMVKGKKVAAYGGVEGEWVSNLLTANQADVEAKNATGFQPVGSASLTSYYDSSHPERVKHGSRSLQVVVNGLSAGFETDLTTVGDPNQTYSAMLWLYQGIEGQGGKVKLYIQEYDDDNVLVGETDSNQITLSNHWVRYSVSRPFTTGTKAKLKVVTDGTAQNITFYADQLMLYKGTGVDVWMPGGQSIGFSDNPAWCLLDLMRNGHYGVGYNDSQLEMDSFRTVAQYCAEQIRDLNSTDLYNIQPRFRLNLVLDWQESWIQVFNKLRMNFNAYAIERQGKFALRNNISESSSQSFDYDDIVPDSLSVNWHSLDQDYDIVRTYYTDPEQKWIRQYTESRIFDYDPLLPIKPKILEIQLFGTTSRWQASRISAYHYRRHKYCTLTGEFKTSMMAANCTPGDIIDITYPPFVWDHQPVMITSMQQMENHDVRITFENYHDDIFSDDEGTDDPGATASEILKPEYVVPKDPENLEVEEFGYTNVVGVFVSAIDVSFTQPKSEFYSHALIQLSTDGKNYRDAGITYGEVYRVEPVSVATTYYVRVKSVSSAGLQSSGTTSTTTIDIVGHNLPLDDITAIASRYENNILTIVWNPITDNRPFVYEVRKGNDWDTAVFLAVTPMTRFASQGSGTYLIKPVYSEVYSVNPAVIQIVDSIITQNVVEIHDEYSSGWQGAVSDGAVKVDGVIKLAGSNNVNTMFDNIPDFDNLASLDFHGGIQPFGTYTIPESHRIDIGVAENCNILGSITVSGEEGPGFEGDPGSFVDGKIYIRVAQEIDELSGMPAFGDWSEFIPGPYLGRVFDFKVELSSSDNNVTAVLSAFTFSVDMADKYDQETETWVEESGSVIPFNYKFHSSPQLLIAVLNATGGETVVLKTNEIAKSQFRVQIVDALGTPVRRQINWVAKGY